MTARVHDSHVVHAILENANGHKTLFSRRPIYYFHSGLSPIPDLALLVKKRFWSGGVSEQSVVARVISSKPGILHLDRRQYPDASPINPFLKAEYKLVWNEGPDEVWVATREHPK